MSMHFIENIIQTARGEWLNHWRSDEFENHKFLEIFHEIDISTRNNKQSPLSATNVWKKKELTMNFRRLKFNQRMHAAVQLAYDLWAGKRTFKCH